jgi:membrane-associated phospholipid phosphatase
VQRERPDMSDHRSFPSGHASNAFAMASVFARHYKKLAIPLYGVATYVAASRMAANKHYFSDVVAGSGLGWVIGRSVVRRNGRPPDSQALKPDEPAPHEATWQVVPWGGPAGDGTGFRLTVSF